MAVLTAPVILANGGVSGEPRWAVLSFQKVTAADTFDVSTLQQPFQTVTAALGVASSNRTATVTLGGISGTVVTIQGTGIANDSVLLFVVGT